MDSLRDRVARLPRSPGVYQWLGADGGVLYVGKAKDLRSRTMQYIQDGAHKPEMMEHARDIAFIAVRTNKEALLLEQTLIKRHKPRYNVRLTDDKQYPYLKLTSGPWPRLLKTHRRLDDGATYFGPFPDGYGAYHVLHVLNDLFPLRRCKTVPTQKCLYYDIGKCIAPCIDACTPDEYATVVAEIKDVLKGRSKNLLRRVKADMETAAASHRFEDAARLRDQLRGLEGVLEKQHMVQDRLQDRDVAAIEARGDLGVVSLLHQRDGKIVGQSLFTVHVADETPEEALADFLRGHYTDRPVPRHVAALLAESEGPVLEMDLRTLAGHAVTVEVPQRGEKMRWLDVAGTNARLRLEEESLRRQRRGMGAVEALQAALGLAELPRVIEGFDVSHQAGHHTRAAMVRFVDGEPDKKGYRTFGMKSVGEDAIAKGQTVRKYGAGREVDDFASMEEAVSRRFRGLVEREEPFPDLVLIDGGPGQLGAARRAMAEQGAAHVAVCSLAKQDEEVFLPKRLHPVKLRRDDIGLQLLQRVRDESHRFGITQVRKKAVASVVSGPLDEVKGIGPKRRAELIKAFGGLEGLRAASVEDLAKFPGISEALARRVVAVLNS